MTGLGLSGVFHWSAIHILAEGHSALVWVERGVLMMALREEILE